MKLKDLTDAAAVPLAMLALAAWIALAIWLFVDALSAGAVLGWVKVALVLPLGRSVFAGVEAALRR